MAKKTAVEETLDAGVVYGVKEGELVAAALTADVAEYVPTTEERLDRLEAQVAHLKSKLGGLL